MSASQPCLFWLYEMLPCGSNSAEGLLPVSLYVWLFCGGGTLLYRGDISPPLSIQGSMRPFCFMAYLQHFN